MKNTPIADKSGIHDPPEFDASMSPGAMLDDCQGLPTVLFASNVDESVFTVESQRKIFEDFFRVIGPVQFVYLPSFRRVRIGYETSEQATQARISLHHLPFNGQHIRLYFAQAKANSEQTNLLPPVPEKLYLISPPASPPIGWKQVEESEPVFNFDLLTAVIEMAPGSSHEVHKGTSSTPSVVVHVCEDLPQQGTQVVKNKIQQTRRPGL